MSAEDVVEVAVVGAPLVPIRVIDVMLLLAQYRIDATVLFPEGIHSSVNLRASTEGDPNSDDFTIILRCS